MLCRKGKAIRKYDPATERVGKRESDCRDGRRRAAPGDWEEQGCSEGTKAMQAKKVVKLR